MRKGQIDERVTHPDGAIVDLLERSDTRRATLHVPDEYTVDVNTDGAALTLNQVHDIASTSALCTTSVR